MKTYKISNFNINAACEEAEQYLLSHKVESKTIIQVKFNIEEALLHYQKMLGEDAEFMMDSGNGIGRSRIRLIVPGPKFNPFIEAGTYFEEDVFIRNALNQMGRLPRLRYKNGANEIVFTAEKKKLPEWMRLIFAISAAVIFGIGVKALPAGAGMFVRDDVITPLVNSFLGFLNAVAGPMIFLAVVWGIYSIGDVATFGEVGKRLTRVSGLSLILMSTLVALISIPIFNLDFGGVKTGSDFSSLYQMVLDIIPNNLFTPFSQGNTLQILFVAVIVGVSMLMIGKNTQAVADIAEQLGYIVNGIMSVISSLVPFFVFGSLFSIVSSSEFERLAAGGKFFLASLVGCASLLAMHTAVTCVRCKMSPAELWKKTLPTFLITITTASSSAAFAENLRACKEELGISTKLANFGVPFGQILYKPAVSILFWFSVISTNEADNTGISLTWILTALFMCIVLSAAAPPVPGGMSASFTILFSQLGLDQTYIAIILSLSSILDFAVTATNIFSTQCVLKVTSEDFDSE